MSQPSSEVDESGCKTSAKYMEYIETHMETMKKKCAKFTSCIEKLLSGESAIAVLKGANIDLDKICGLVYKDARTVTNTTRIQCTASEKQDIKTDLNEHLKDEIEAEGPGWRGLKKCLKNNYGDDERSTYVDEICGLLPETNRLCNKFPIHKQVEDFFNQQISHLKCTCAGLTSKSSDSSGLPLAAAVGISMGSLLLLVLTIAACCFIYHHKKKKKEKPRQVIYLPAPNSDHHAVYQEAFDKETYQGVPSTPSSHPPSLPSRYTRHPTSTLPRLPGEEPEYLEPVLLDNGSSRRRPKLPPPAQALENPGYEAPPKYSERDENAPTEMAPTEPPEPPEDGAYFEPIPALPSCKAPEEAYDSLGHAVSEPSNSQTAYQALGDVKDEEKEALVPPSSPPHDSEQASNAETKEKESPYFELEKVSDDESDVCVEKKQTSV